MPIEPEEKQDSTIPPSEKVAFYDDALDLSPSQVKIEEKQEETRSGDVFNQDTCWHCNC